jgi:uncharacterized YccA/Bax inhibitor family protein
MRLHHRHLDLEYLFCIRQVRGRDAVGAGGRYRRLNPGPGDHLQTGLGRRHRALYALAEGLVIGGISSIAEAQFPGIVIQAVGLTFGTCLALLMAYKSGLIRATEGFKKGIVAATGGILLFYLVTFVLSMFGICSSLIYGSGLLSIGISLVIVTIAALNLVLDFDFIEQGAAQGAPKYMEWYGAFGLMVTLIWLYIEILNLLMKLYSRD